MYEYFFQFADIHIRIAAPFRIHVSSESIPFKSQGIEEPHLILSFLPVDSLPTISLDGNWIEDRYYRCVNGSYEIIVRSFPGADPYARLVYGDGSIQCEYLSNFESKFTETCDILNQIGLEKILLDHSGFLLHSSLIRYQNKAILFSAPCGVGKSTQADLWNRFRSAEILNGDRAGVRFSNHFWCAYGMPFAGTSGIYQNASAPIAAVVTLDQGPENLIQRLRPMEAIRRLLMECSCRRWDSEFMNRMLDLLLKFVSLVPVYHLVCRPDEGAVNLLYDTLLKDGLL